MNSALKALCKFMFYISVSIKIFFILVQKKKKIYTLSRLRYFAFNYTYAGGGGANSHSPPRSPLINTPYHFTSFKPLSLRGDRAAYRVLVNSFGDPPEVWSDSGIVVRPGNSGFDVSGGGGGGAASSGGGDLGNSKDGCWGVSNLGKGNL
jgi:ATP-dependent Clp protease ATP-binding subunit ClpX